MTKNRQDQEKTPKQDRFSEEKQGLADFGRKLDEVTAAREAPSKLASKIKQPPGSALGLAMRVSVEVVSALVVGFAVGWSLDKWLDTSPWLMLVFLLLGGAAGMLNVYRMARGLSYAGQYDEIKEDTEEQSDRKSDD